MGSSRVSPVVLDALLESASELVFWTSADRKLLGVNRAWEAFTGLSRDAVIGLDCRSAGGESSDDPSSIVAAFHVPTEAIQGSSAATDALLKGCDGEHVWKRIEFSPLHSSDGELVAVIGIVRERTAPSAFPDAESEHLRLSLSRLRQEASARRGLEVLVGKGDAHRRLIDQVVTAANSPAPVIIVGEPGTGKRLVAQTIHHVSHRESGSLFAIDCEALPADLLERSLFGTASSADHPAGHRFDYPDHATLILENGLGLPRDLQERIVNSGGAARRWIVTCSTDPETAFREERLRADFYYRFTTLIISLAPLRERIDELPLLAQSFLERANARLKTARVGFTDDALDTLRAYDWPGNLFELSRVITAAVTRAKGDRIEREDLPASIQGEFASSYLPQAAIPAAPAKTLDEILEEVERKLIEKALTRHAGNKSRAAESLGISRPRLHRRINELKIADGAEPVK